MSDEAGKRRIRGFDVVAIVGLVVGALGLLFSGINTYFQFFHSRNSVLVFVRDVKTDMGGHARRVKANLVFVNNGTEQATILGFYLHTLSEDENSYYSGGNLLGTEYDNQQRLLPATLAPGSTKIMGVDLPMLPSGDDVQIAERMVVYLYFETATSSGRVVESRYRIHRLHEHPEMKVLVPYGERDKQPHQLFP